jgi:response regulator RpfG family c-di-GMP phosphodiesterase/serine/threonine protein kinase
MRADLRVNGNSHRDRTVYSDPAASGSHDFIDELLVKSFVHAEDWKQLPKSAQERMLGCHDRRQVLSMMVEASLLTEYQAARIAAGTTFGLVLGNYRILKRLGAGGMAVVFKAEHVEMRHTVALKVLPQCSGQDERMQSRFTAEMRIVARLHHPNIVAALDAGRVLSDGPEATVLWYLVMEYVPGLDLEASVSAHGPMTMVRACNLIYQAASALQEINKYQLVHRDIKPSNIMVTPEDQAKLLDFGLSRQLDTRVTQPGTLLGTIDFMAPEQARDASSVDIRADIYSLGGTLFWCLTGRLPSSGSWDGADVLRRFQKPAPSARQFAPDVPHEMDAVLARMMAHKPEDRYTTPQAVMRALLPFLKPKSVELPGMLSPELPLPGLLSTGTLETKSAKTGPRILIVDDEEGIRQFCRVVLQGDGRECDEAPDAEAALAMLREKPYDLMLTDIGMPGMSGLELTRKLRESPPCPHLKILMFSGGATSDELAKMLSAGADDFFVKPLSIITLQGRVLAALRMKDAQDRADLLNRRLLVVNGELERNLSSKEGDLVQARNALVLALAKLVEHREGQASARLARMQQYCRVLAQEAATTPAFSEQINEGFIEMLACCAPMHDIGKIGLPDHILLKPGKLTVDERIVMQTHTTIGAGTLKQVAQSHGVAVAFLNVAADIARHHHERWDGTGYPDALAGNDIPLPARFVTLCDVYDALRSRRAHKPALAHAAALQLMSETCQGQFDPGLFALFLRRGPDFERIFREFPDA